MFRMAIQIKDIITSNVTSALDGVSNPDKMLRQFQREIEEAIIALRGEVTRASRRHEQLEVERSQAELREADWNDKAKIAMDNNREDLAREALFAREDCRKGLDALRADIQTLVSDIADMEQALDDLEAKRGDIRQRLADQLAADGQVAANGGGTGYALRTDKRMDRIARLEQRAHFAASESATCRGHAAVERDIKEMRQAGIVEAELASLRESSAKPPTASPKTKSRRKAK